MCIYIRRIVSSVRGQKQMDFAYGDECYLDHALIYMYKYKKRLLCTYIHIYTYTYTCIRIYVYI